MPSHFAYQDMDEDGRIDEEELREFLRSKRREGKLRVDIDTSIPAMMNEYDPDQNGFLSIHEFLRLQKEVLAKPKDPIKEMHDIFADIGERLNRADATRAANAAQVDLRMDLLEKKLDFLLEGAPLSGHTRRLALSALLAISALPTRAARYASPSAAPPHQHHLSTVDRREMAARLGFTFSRPSLRRAPPSKSHSGLAATPRPPGAQGGCGRAKPRAPRRSAPSSQRPRPSVPCR